MSWRLLARIAIGAALLGGGIGSAAATPPAAETPIADDGSDLDGLQVVADEELARDRGGFSWAGVEIGLGAEIRTYLDGSLVLQTNISWTPSGATTTQVVSAALTPASAAQLQAGLLTSGGISMRVGNQSVFLANGGDTALIQPTDGSIQNILINRASNVTARQEIDAVLDLGNFGQFQHHTNQDRIGDAINSAVALGTLAGLGH